MNPKSKTDLRSPILLMAVVLALIASPARAAKGDADPDADYDRMDGTGTSGKTVNVIEWEGNLEIHVAPRGSLAGLGLKLDKRVKDKPVMVISYRFDSDPQRPLIRRAILGIELREGFKTYRDRSEPDYDKIVITNNTLATGAELATFRLDAEPKQLYPDGHPALATKGKDASRKVASNGKADAQAAEESDETQEGQVKRKKDESEAARVRLEQDGSITPFFARPGTEARGRSRDQRPQATPAETE